MFDVTFCVIDLVTTGGSPATCEITEVGAVKLRGGECLGTLQTLVNPGLAVPPSITVLTGITDAMLIPAPPIDEVLPSLLEFVGDAVVVGHNVRFDLSFLNAALERSGRPRLANRHIDTCALARRLVRDEVPNCTLGTLAERFRLGHRPTHRAFDDAAATGELLHVLLERAGGLGVTGLDDLLALPRLAAHPQAAKLRLTTELPRSPGVYLFRDRHDRVLYVGKATNLRARVRSYFSGDERRKIGSLLRELHRIEHRTCASPLEAAVREVRLIHRFTPRYNRQAATWSRYRYLKLTLGERFPRLSVVTDARADGALYLGPLSSTRAARQVAEAIESVLPLRRCTARVGAQRTGPVCTAAQLGVATCPCAGQISDADYAQIVRQAVQALTLEPQVLLEPLHRRMAALAEDQRFEEAADVRDRAAALSLALARQRRLDRLRRSGHVVLRLRDGTVAELRAGRLDHTWEDDEQDPALQLFDPGTVADLDSGNGDNRSPWAPLPPLPPLPRHHADEVLCVASCLDSAAGTVDLLRADGPLATPLPFLPTFAPTGG